MVYGNELSRLSRVENHYFRRSYQLPSAFPRFGHGFVYHYIFLYAFPEQNYLTGMDSYQSPESSLHITGYRIIHHALLNNLMRFRRTRLNFVKNMSANGV